MRHSPKHAMQEAPAWLPFITTCSCPTSLRAAATYLVPYTGTGLLTCSIALAGLLLCLQTAPVSQPGPDLLMLLEAGS